jgi:serine/threonine protein kinase
VASLLSASQLIAGYEIVDLVGKGGMGEVYRAKQLSMDRVVALKVLSTKLAKSDPSFAKRFVEEARAAGRLSHPHIISVHDVGRTLLKSPAGDEEVYYFSMEFVDGETVKDVIQRDGACTADLVNRVMQAMAAALVYAESMGVVHRDIKPENIIITATGEVKLADLGLAQQVGAENSVQEAGHGSGGRRVMGTPLYMSPEQARGLAVDHRSDHYSLGATLFHMLTGHPPFSGENSKAIMKAHVAAPIPDPSATADVPEEWRQLCMKLMAKVPGDRFATAVDLQQAVKHACAGTPLLSVSRRARAARRKAKQVTQIITVFRGMPTPVKYLSFSVLAIIGLAILWVLATQVSPAPRPAPDHQIDPAQTYPVGGQEHPPSPQVDDLAGVAALISSLPSDPQAAVDALDAALADARFAAAIA